MPTSRTGTHDAPRTPRGRRSSRSASAARNEIIGLIKDDHRKAKKAFRDFEKMDIHESPEDAHALVITTCGELRVHTTLEEELLYPAARGSLDMDALIDEAEVEHTTAKDLIAKLEGMRPEDDKYEATFCVLGEYIRHHIREEEREMLPQLARARLDWTELQQQMAERREALVRQHLPQEPGEAEEEDEDDEDEEPGGFVPEKPDVQDDEGLPEG